jgi:raffinose/stachyose/melibiose transport system substrate-binding protein
MYTFISLACDKGEGFMKRLNKKLKLVLITAIVCSLFIAGCKKENAGTVEGNARKNTELNIFFYNETLVEGFNSLAAAFNKDNTNIIIKTEMIGPEYNTVLKTKEAAGKLPEIFAASSPGEPALKPYIDAKKIADVSSLKIIEKLSKEYKKSITFSDGKIYTIPFTNIARGLIYNEDIFKKCGIYNPPRTLDELKEVCEKLKDKGFTPFAISGKAGWSLGSCIFQPGQEIFSSVEWALNRDAGKASFKDNALPVFDLIDIVLENCQPKVLNTDFMDALAIYGEEKAAMLLLTSDSIDVLAQISPTAAEKSRMIAIPYTNDSNKNKLYFDYGATFSVSSKADIAAVDKFFDYIVNGDGKEIFAKEMMALNPYGIDFESTRVNKDVLALVKSGDIINVTQYLLMPDGFWQCNANAMQSYIGGRVNKVQMLEMLDKDWDSISGKK